MNAKVDWRIGNRLFKVGHENMENIFMERFYTSFEVIDEENGTEKEVAERGVNKDLHKFFNDNADLDFGFNA